MKGFFKNMVGRAKGQASGRILQPAFSPIWASIGHESAAPATRPNESALQQWPDAFDGNPVQMPAPQAKSAIVQEATPVSHLPRTAPLHPTGHNEAPVTANKETVDLEPPAPMSPLALADSIFGPLVVPLSSPSQELPTPPPSTPQEASFVPPPPPAREPLLGNGPRPLKTLHSESGPLPALAKQPPLRIKAVELDPETASPAQPLSPSPQQPQVQPTAPGAPLLPRQAQQQAQLGQQPAAQQGLAPIAQQPSLQPLRQQTPAPQRSEAAASRSGLVIGKLTIEVVEPSKPQVIAQQVPQQQSTAPARRNQSFRPHSNLKFGLGQL